MTDQPDHRDIGFASRRIRGCLHRKRRIVRVAAGLGQAVCTACGQASPVFPLGGGPWLGSG